MYCYVIQELGWREINDQFARFFRVRTRDGLIRVYYRIRKEWGMKLCEMSL